MSVIAVKALGTLHGIVALLSLHFAFKIFALPESAHLSRARIIYVGRKAIFVTCMLALCTVAAWQRPSLAWVFAAVSLLGYMPAPTSTQAAAKGHTTLTPFGERFRRYLPFAMAARVAGVLLLALAAYGLDG